MIKKKSGKRQKKRRKEKETEKLFQMKRKGYSRS
jgi:hypothetical protein